MKMPIMPNMELVASVICVFMRMAIKIPVIIGIISTQGVMLNDECNAVIISNEWEVLFVGENNPTVAYMSNARTIAGVDVSIRYLMWVKSSTLHEDEARMVVSDNGDTLSPKYAPEIIAPAIHPSLYPITLPIP